MILLIVQILCAASLILSLYIIVTTMERCRSEKRYGFVYCIVTLFLYTLGYLIEISSGSLEGAVIGVKIMYAGGAFMGPFFFFFVAGYCEIKVPKKIYKLPLLIISALFYIVVLTFDRHQLMYESFFFSAYDHIPVLMIEPGTLYVFGVILLPLFTVILSCIVLIRGIKARGQGRRFDLILLLAGALAPMLANIVYVALIFFETPLAGVNFVVFAMIVSNFIFYLNVVRNDMFDLAPKALAATMDLIRDSFVVLDQGLAYTGSNVKAKELFPGLEKLNKGANILGLENWPPELKNGSGAGKEEIEFTMSHKPGKVYSAWTNRIVSESGVTQGWVILIQDITETVNLIRNIRAQRDEIAAMRDNMKEGIFLMDREFRIQDSYSRALKDILSGKNFEGRSFIDLLNKSYNKKDLATVADYLNMVIDESVDPQMLEEMNPLAEFSYVSTETGEKKNLRCLFAPVVQGNGDVFLMGTIQDITAETILKKQLAGEELKREEEMRSLFEIMQVDQKVLGNFMEDTGHEFRRINKMLQDAKSPTRQKLISLYQSVHAIKSNAVIVGLYSYGRKLHDLETEIKALNDNEEKPGVDQLLDITMGLQSRMRDLENFHEIINRLKNFSIAAAAAAGTDDEVFLESLKKACDQIAEAEGKKTVFITESFDPQTLSLGPQRDMKDILTQLVRNAVHHGIERPEERVTQGKDETGKITLSMKLENNNAVRIILSDDGKGLDFDRIADKAQALGLLKNPSAARDNPKQLLKFIFNPSFSTTENENIHAGRGIGLNLVKDRLREIKGTINIQSKKGKGLVFDIKLPLKKAL